LSHLPQGGAERQTLNLIKGLDINLFEVTLVLYRRQEVFYKEVFDYNIKIIERKYQFRSKIFKTIDNALFLWLFLRNNEFDIIHTLLFHNGFWVRLLAPSYYNNRIVYSVRSSLENVPSFILKFEKKFIKKSIVVTNSIKGKNEFIELVGEQFKDSVINIYNGILIPELKEKISNEKIIIGTVGRQAKEKNQIQILRVLNKIRNIHDFSFFLIGDASLDQSKIIQEYILQNDLRDIVTVMDSQNNIQEYYEQFDIFILSSYSEGCPNVLFEAMASNVLVISSAGANSDGFIKNGYNGYVYDGTDHDLERKITEILKSKDVIGMSIIKSRGRNFVVSNFSIEVMINNYEKVYFNILDRIL